MSKIDMQAWVDWTQYDRLIPHLSNADLATTIGCDPAAVRHRRTKLGLPPWPRRTKRIAPASKTTGLDAPRIDSAPPALPPVSVPPPQRFCAHCDKPLPVGSSKARLYHDGCQAAHASWVKRVKYIKATEGAVSKRHETAVATESKWDRRAREIARPRCEWECSIGLSSYAGAMVDGAEMATSAGAESHAGRFMQS